MDNGVHFISGLPRSGSTLLAAILQQNPALHAGMSSPVAGLTMAMQRQLSQDNEGAVFVHDAQRLAIMRGVFDGYYHALHPSRTVLDTNRVWCAKLPLLHRLFPSGRVLACVRHVSWILDSIERLVRANALAPSRMFEWDAGGSVYSRSEGLCSGNGLIGGSLNALREGVHGEHADKLLLVTYQTLTTDPSRALAAVYDHLGLPAFEHDFANVSFDDAGFDARLGLPGLHSVGRIVKPQLERKTVLPPELFNRLVGDSFWTDPERLPSGIKIV